MTWMVTGGAGYVGSEIAYQLLAVGVEVVIVDDLSTSSARSIPSGAKFLEIDLRDPRLTRALAEHGDFDGVIHAAGIKYAGDSSRHPEEHYSRNVAATVDLLNICRKLGIPRFIFSSSAAVYGTPENLPATEETPLRPESPYGRSKLAAEWAIADFASAHSIDYTCLRFFNVAGIGGSGVADSSPFNLFPNLVRTLQGGADFELFGTDLATLDGTCVRDYVHVSDVALGHIATIASWEAGRSLAHAYNLSLGRGTSVRQIICEFEKVVGFPLAVRELPHRSGDPAMVWGSNDLAVKDLGWRPVFALEEMVHSCLRGLAG